MLTFTSNYLYNLWKRVYLIYGLITRHSSCLIAIGYFLEIKMKFLLIIGLISCISIAFAEQETLVLVDNFNIRETHSQFFKSLHGKNIRCCRPKGRYLE